MSTTPSQSTQFKDVSKTDSTAESNTNTANSADAEPESDEDNVKIIGTTTTATDISEARITKEPGNEYEDSDEDMLLLSSPEHNTLVTNKDKDSQHMSSISSDSGDKIDKFSSEGSEDEDDLEIIEDEDDESDDVEFENDGGFFHHKKVNIFYCHGSLFVWNAQDVKILREAFRIIGKLTGCLPRAPRQNVQLGLPLQLMSEEAKLLVDIGAAVVVEEDAVTESALQIRRQAFTNMREENLYAQQELYKECRKEEVRQHMDEIIAGKKAKKRKLQQAQETEKGEPPLDTKVDSSISQEKRSKTAPGDESKETEKVGDGEEEEEEDKLTVDDLVTTETSAKHSLVQLFTENPWKQEVHPSTQWIFPETEGDLLRYFVFRDLWRRGYFLTSGAKFGGDFLVYPGDPSRFHSHYVAICKDRKEAVPALDIVSLGRLGSNVRKSALLCSLDKMKRVVYTSLQWSGIV